MDELLTVVDLAARLKVPVSTARQMLASGNLRGFKIGNRWRVTASELHAYIAQRSAKAAVVKPVDITRLPGFPKKRMFG